ncbi:MAG: DNA-methyltransferase [Phycisphaerae bacterium]
MLTNLEKIRAPRNRTLTCNPVEQNALGSSLQRLTAPAPIEAVTNAIINQDCESALPYLPTGFVDLLLLDPPYNLTKNFHGHVFREQNATEYRRWFEKVLKMILPSLKPDATVYVCSDWHTSAVIFPVLDEHFLVRNRITWEREKGRGAKSNWKNNSEDIWFCTVGDVYHFDVEAVKLKRRVLAPYRKDGGEPKDWFETEDGNYRLTHPSNLWTDITVPFWSMPENTDHPTQKPEKLIAKLVLASCAENGFVLDPFLGSGTTAVVAKKLHRRFCGIELNAEYCCWAAKRLQLAVQDPSIQGYSEGVFWERNTATQQVSARQSQPLSQPQGGLFDE